MPTKTLVKQFDYTVQEPALDAKQPGQVLLNDKQEQQAAAMAEYCVRTAYRYCINNIEKLHNICPFCHSPGLKWIDKKVSNRRSVRNTVNYHKGNRFCTTCRRGSA